jgi:DNA-binding CsgD family transcriptional regulator
MAVLYITPRERETLQLLANGWVPTAIASRLGISEPWLQTDLEALFAKMGASSETDALAIARCRGLITSGKPSQASTASAFASALSYL